MKVSCRIVDGSVSIILIADLGDFAADLAVSISQKHCLGWDELFLNQSLLLGLTLEKNTVVIIFSL